MKPTSTLVALNTVSCFAHFAQFGVLYPLVALYLQARGVAAWEVGVVGSLFWTGMLAGSTTGPMLMFYFGVRKVVALAASLTCAAGLAFTVLPVQGAMPVWLLWGSVGAFVGAGTGLRWVANESWLYALLPSDKRGTLVGWHETLIHAMQTAGPMLIAAVGVATAAGFYWAALSAACVLLALPFAQADMPASACAPNVVSPLSVLRGMWAALLQPSGSIGVRLGLWSGVLDGVLYGMFAVYCTQRGFSTQQAATLMVVFGAGGLLTSAPMGMLCDRKGVGYVLRLMVWAGVAMSALLLLPVGLGGDSGLWFAAAVLGMLSPLTLTMILATQDATETGGDMGQSIGQVSLAFTMGTIAGPALAGVLLDVGGSAAYVALVAALCLVGLKLKVR
jgi:MFS family permease